jgi:hypothetical protein
MAMNTEFLCGEAGCAALGMAFAAAILILAVIVGLYERWLRWANRSLEELERDIRCRRYLKKTAEHDRAASGSDKVAA